MRRGRSTLAVLMMLTGATTMADGAPQDPPSWGLGVATSGGVAGTGRGSLSLGSDGKLVASPPSPLGGTTRPARVCEATLEGAELQRIAAAVARADLAAWRARKPDAAAPDAFGYTLTLQRAGDEVQANWYDNTRSRLPADLTELYAALEAAWDRALAACRR